MPYDEITGFPMSKKTWYEISEENYFKILEKAQSDYPEEIKDILKPKETTVVIEPLTKRDILGIISIHNLSNDFPNMKTAKITTLRNKFKKLVVGESNEELNNYLMTEDLMDRAINTKRKEIQSSFTKHNKTKKLFNFILSNYLDLDLEDPKKSKEVPEELKEEDFTEDEELEVDLEEVVENPEEIQD